MTLRKVGPRHYECLRCGGQGGPTWTRVEHREGCPVVEAPDVGPLYDEAVRRGTARLVRELVREREGDPAEALREATQTGRGPTKGGAA